MRPDPKPLAKVPYHLLKKVMSNNNSHKNFIREVSEKLLEKPAPWHPDGLEEVEKWMGGIETALFGDGGSSKRTKKNDGGAIESSGECLSDRLASIIVQNNEANASYGFDGTKFLAFARAEGAPVWQANVSGSVDNETLDEQAQEVLTSIAASMVYSAQCLTVDEWVEVRDGVECRGLHVLSACRENQWLAAWCGMEGIHEAIEPPEALEEVQDLLPEAQALQERLETIRNALPEGARSNKPPKAFPKGTGASSQDLAPATFLISVGTHGGLTPYELYHLEYNCLCFDLPRWLRIVYLAQDGMALAHLNMHPCWLLLNEYRSHGLYSSYLNNLPAVPVYNPVAGGRWGEMLTVALCNDDGKADDKEAIVQVQHFFQFGKIEDFYAYSFAEKLALVEAAAKEGTYNPHGREYWKVDLGSNGGQNKTKLSDFELDPQRLETIVKCLRIPD